MSLVGYVTAAGVVKWAESGVVSQFEPGVGIGSSGATARPTITTVTRSRNTHQQKHNHAAMGFAGASAAVTSAGGAAPSEHPPWTAAGGELF